MGSRVNSRYFAYRDHLRYVDAGYRWAYWTLEQPGVVSLGQAIELGEVFACEAYWNPPAEEYSR